MKKLTLRITSIYFAVSGFTIVFLIYIASVIKQNKYYWPILFGIYLLGVIVFYLWADRNTKLIIKMNDMVKAFAKGNLTPTVFITEENELGEINRSMHEMAENLNQHLKKTIQEKDRMETILASMVEGVLAFDTSGRLMLMNKTAEDMLGITFEESAELFFLEILRNHQMADLLKQGLADGKRQVIEVKLSPGDPEYYRVYITPIIGKNGSCQGAIMVLRNVTKVRLLEQMRTDFVANVSHELRTPLTSIKGYVETLLDGTLDNREISEHFLTIINSEADRLNRLISDLLYLSELETGRMEVVKKEINSREFMEKAVTLLMPVAQGKGISFEIDIHESAENFRGNQDMMEQVMINLLENAIKYSHNDGVIRIEVFPHEQGTAIRVIDRGIGIPAESLPRIFERFYRVDKARSRQIGGTGLGLSIIKHVVDRHSGQVQVESEEDRGTTFTIILPRI